jgi:aerobic carbon-monoxide dehydrogenase medium subunit
MKPPPFTYVRCTTVDDALTELAAHGETCKVLAGGQSLVPLMNLRMTSPGRLVDINGLSMLDYVGVEDKSLRIGALTRHSTLRDSPLVAEHCPLMRAAYQYVGHKPVRNRGTLGGNLSHAYPASEMPAVVLAAAATMHVRSATGERVIAAGDFFLGMMEPALEADELLVEVRIPVRPPGQGWSFLEVSPRKGDFALVGVGATLRIENGVCEIARIAYCGIGDRARRAPEAEQSLIGAEPGEALFRAAAEIAGDLIDPESDYHADAAYRRDLMRTLTRRALVEAHGRCG